MKILENVESYKVCEPLFEGVRVIMTYLGEKYTPQYIQGIAGASFRVATGCPSRPTCCYLMWPTDLIRLLGYEYTESPCVGPDNENLTEEMIAAVKNQIDLGRCIFRFKTATLPVILGHPHVRIRPSLRTRRPPVDFVL